MSVNKVKGFKYITAIVLVTLTSSICSGQKASQQRAFFTEAKSHYLFGEYELANPLYLILNELIADNFNIKYKIGDCYLNIPDERSKAIPYLEEAVKHAVAGADPESFNERNAPLEAIFALANAYRINNELEKAISTYQMYLKMTGESGDEVNNEFVNQQISACKNALVLMESPVDIEKINLGPTINQGSVNFNPSVSFDGNTMVFTERRGLENAIFYTVKERGIWQTPVEITSQIGDGRDCSTSSLNNDGTELYLYKTDNFDGNIYVSNLVDGLWSTMRKLNTNINTKFYESHASISSDGQKLYFTSNKPGGQGELDIYVSTRSGGDNWGPAVNLGSTVNTPFNEDSPFITEAGSFIFFVSEGHSSMGGHDIYKSANLGESWKTPENIGYPVNTTDSDLFFQPFNNGKSGYYTIRTGYKNSEIFLINFNELKGHDEFFISGTMSVSDTTLGFTDNFNIYLINITEGDTIESLRPNTIPTDLSFVTTPGSYRFIFSGRGYFSQEFDTTFTPKDSTNQILFNIVLLKDSTFIEEVIVYDKIDLSLIPTISAVDSSNLVTNVVLKDIGDLTSDDENVLYYTVQVMALYNPVDISYFKYITDMVVMYNAADRFYRYTSGNFKTREEAYAYRLHLISKGYPQEIFIKKVFKE